MNTFALPGGRYLVLNDQYRKSTLLSTTRRRIHPISRLSSTRRAIKILRFEYASLANGIGFVPGDGIIEELRDQRNLFRRVFQALSYNGIEGDCVEFGCNGATTFTLAWGASRLMGYQSHFWAFDSFQGLPHSTDPRDSHPGWSEGAMAMAESDFVAKCIGNGIDRESFTTVPGFYETTLSPAAAGPRPDRISFAYVDCDLYTSSADVLQFVADRLCHGAVIAFDDYFCFSPTHASGERLAALEIFEHHPRWTLVPYIQWGWYGMAFMVEEKFLSSYKRPVAAP
jgi:O-methyltransferase